MFIKSIRNFLIIGLLASAFLTSTIIVAGDFFFNTKDIRAQQDSQLISTALILASLANQVDFPKTNSQEIANSIDGALTLKSNITNTTKNGLSKMNIEYEVWGRNDVILLRSHIFYQPIADSLRNELSDATIDGKKWRRYSYYDAPKKLHILVAQQDQIRDQFAYSLIKDNILIILLTYPLIGLVSWFLIRIALRSFKQLAQQITHRASSHLEPVDTTELPSEIFPFADALNNLFFRLKLSIEQMKRFSSNASHELRTPLAAIKTQAEVALASIEPHERNCALAKVLIGVDRASHVVKQLLVLSRLEPDSLANNLTLFNFSRLVIEITAQLTPSALKKNIDIELESHEPDANIIGNETSIGILVRNLIDNAIRYTPNKGHVKIAIISSPHENITILRVTDNGPGIPAEYRARVFERFFRVLGTKESGSGLGLAIVKQIADLHKASITLGMPASGQGLEVNVFFSNNPRSA